MKIGDTYTIEIWDEVTKSPKTITMKVVAINGNIITSENV